MQNHPSDVRPPETVSLLKRIQAVLHGQPMLVLRQLKVEVSGETVFIQGKVRTFYERQVGVECCKRVAGVHNVVDLIKVDSSKERRVPDGLPVPQANINHTIANFMP